MCVAFVVCAAFFKNIFLTRAHALSLTIKISTELVKRSIVLGLVGNALEDVPQLAVQIVKELKKMWLDFRPQINNLLISPTLLLIFYCCIFLFLLQLFMIRSSSPVPVVWVAFMFSGNIYTVIYYIYCTCTYTVHIIL